MTILEKLNLFFKNIYLDYSEVFKEIHRGAKARPLKASLYGLSTIFVLNLFRTNEGLRSYQDEVIHACNRVASVSEGSRNPRSYKFVQDIGALDCHGLLREVDLGFSTLIYKADCNINLASYRYTCPYLRPSMKEFFLERIVDLGMLGHWLLLETNMQDYDVNEEEYNDLSIGGDVQVS